MPWDIQKNNYPSNCNRSLFIYFFNLILDAPRTLLASHTKELDKPTWAGKRGCEYGVFSRSIINVLVCSLLSFWTGRLLYRDPDARRRLCGAVWAPAAESNPLLRGRSAAAPILSASGQIRCDCPLTARNCPLLLRHLLLLMSLLLLPLLYSHSQESSCARNSV